MFKAIIFDLGGVVVNMDPSPKLLAWLDQLKQSSEEIYSSLWNQPNVDAAMRGEISAIDYWTEIGSKIGLEKSEILIFMDAYYENSSPDGRMLDLVRQLKQRGVKIGLLSNTMDDADWKFKELGFLSFFELFDSIILSHKEGIAKPDPGVYLLACKRLGVAPSDSVHIDDVFENVVGARKAGLSGWHYTNNAFDDLKDFLLENTP